MLYDLELMWLLRLVLWFALNPNWCRLKTEWLERNDLSWLSTIESKILLSKVIWRLDSNYFKSSQSPPLCKGVTWANFQILGKIKNVHQLFCENWSRQSQKKKKGSILKPSNMVCGTHTIIIDKEGPWIYSFSNNWQAIGKCLLKWRLMSFCSEINQKGISGFVFVCIYWFPKFFRIWIRASNSI